MVAVIVAYYNPGFEPYMPQIIEGVTIGVVTLVSGYSLQDAIIAYMENKPNDNS
jgi:hypothetical protein